jgi:hypothetical protein
VLPRAAPPPGGAAFTVALGIDATGAFPTAAAVAAGRSLMRLDAARRRARTRQARPASGPPSRHWRVVRRSGRTTVPAGRPNRRRRARPRGRAPAPRGPTRPVPCDPSPCLRYLSTLELELNLSSSLSAATCLISCRRTDTVIPTVPPPDKLCGSQAPPIVEEDEEMERSSVQRCGPRPELRRAASRRPRASPELSMWIWRGERRLSGEAFLYAS